MDIHLKPELEKLVEQDVRRGPYQSADEFVERAVILLHEQEAWLADNQDEIATKVDEGYAAAKRGELFDPDGVRRLMDQKKRVRG